MDIEKRVTPERRAQNKQVFDELRTQVSEVHHRVYNGLGKEIRDEVSKEIKVINTRLWTVLASLFIALIGIIITISVTSATRSAENEKSYRAIIDIGSELRNHIILTSQVKDKQ
jgi:hypothetical protein